MDGRKGKPPAIRVVMTGRSRYFLLIGWMMRMGKSLVISWLMKGKFSWLMREEKSLVISWLMREGNLLRKKFLVTGKKKVTVTMIYSSLYRHCSPLWKKQVR